MGFYKRFCFKHFCLGNKIEGYDKPVCMTCLINHKNKAFQRREDKVAEIIHDFKYPDYLADVPTIPLTDEFVKAFMEIYEYHPKTCKIFDDHAPFSTTLVDEDCLVVATPKGVAIHSGFHDNFTVNPRVENKKDLFYEGNGRIIEKDLDGKIYYRINPHTGMPQQWHYLRYKHVIYNYLQVHDFDGIDYDVDPSTELKLKLDVAIKSEDYEEAARIRDILEQKND